MLDLTEFFYLEIINRFFWLPCTRKFANVILVLANKTCDCNTKNNMIYPTPNETTQQAERTARETKVDKA